MNAAAMDFRLRAADGKFLPEARVPHRIRLRYLPGIDPTPEWWTLNNTPLRLHRHDQTTFDFTKIEISPRRGSPQQTTQK